MANDLTNKYFVKNTEGGSFQDVTTMFNGLRILKVDGFLAQGKPINIYTAQWVDEQEEDFLITTLDGNNNPVVVRENADLDITFIIRQKYASSTIDVMTVHDTFIAYMTNSDVWIKSAYVNNKYVHCICLKEYKPTISKLKRGTDSWIMGTISLHTLDAPAVGTVQTRRAATVAAGANPKALGLLESDGTNYRPTWDTSVVAGKTYYTES